MINYCMNLLKRPDKKILAQAEFDRIGWPVEFIESVDKSLFEPNEHGLLGGYQGLNETLIGILQTAIANDEPEIGIFEDDVLFDDNFVQLYNDNIVDMPIDYDGYYLGCVNLYTPVKKTERIYKVRKAVLGHAVILKRRTYEPLLASLQEMKEASDICISKLSMDFDNYKLYCFKKGIARQRYGYSDSIHTETEPQID